MRNTFNSQTDRAIGLNTSCVEPQLIQVQIQFTSCYCGTALTAIQLPDNCIFLGIVRAGRMIIASAEPTIFCGDYVLALALKPAIVPAVTVILKKTHPVFWSPLQCPLM